MKFFHLSDLHIGLRLMNRDLMEDQEYILRQITEAAGREKPDAIVIAGDIYDKAIPSAEAVKLFDSFVSGLVEVVPEAEIMMISGNHDSGARVNTFRSVLEKQKLHMIGLPPQFPGEQIEKVTMTDEWGRVHFYLLPFVRPSMVRMILGTDEEGGSLSYNDTIHRMIGGEQIVKEDRNVLVSHQFYLPVGADPEKVERMDSEIRTVGNIDEVKADILELFDYAALGHIHKPMKVGSDRYRYCGTPLACSVSESGQQKGILMVEMKEKGNVAVQVLPLTPLRQIRIVKGTLEEVLLEAGNDYTTVILTDRMDLDVFDMQDRIRNAFPNLLEIRREGVQKPEYQRNVTAEEKLDTFQLCMSFLGEPDEEEQELLRDVINSVQEVS